VLLCIQRSGINHIYERLIFRKLANYELPVPENSRLYMLFVLRDSYLYVILSGLRKKIVIFYKSTIPFRSVTQSPNEYNIYYEMIIVNVLTAYFLAIIYFYFQTTYLNNSS
jgi:hypothetical protein